MTKLVLIRGLPGSGKTTKAKSFAGCVHLEADMYHVKGNGEYCFDPSLIRDGHAWCKKTASILMCNGVDVVVSNTFTQLWEMEPYLDFADSIGADVEVIRMVGNYGNTHNVPEDIVERMKKRFESYEEERIVT